MAPALFHPNARPPPYNDGGHWPLRPPLIMVKTAKHQLNCFYHLINVSCLLPWIFGLDLVLLGLSIIILTCFWTLSQCSSTQVDTLRQVTETPVIHPPTTLDPAHFPQSLCHPRIYPSWQETSAAAFLRRVGC